MVSQIFRNFTLAETILIGLIIFLLAALILLLLYAFYLRIYNNYKERYKQKRYTIWENIVLNYLYGEDNAHLFSLNSREREFVFDLKYKDFQIFGGFMENYLIDLRGSEYDRIVELLRTIGYGEILIKALNKADKWGKAYAAHFLGLMKYKEAAPHLLKLVHDKSPVVYLNAFEALHQIGKYYEMPQIMKTILSNKSINDTKIIEIVLGFGNVINPTLISLLQDEGLADDRKRLIIDMLANGNVIESSPDILALARNTGSLELRIGCIKALGKLEYPESASFLIESLKSDNWIIRSQSAKSLGLIGLKSAIPQLMKTLYHEDNYLVLLYSIEALKLMNEEGKTALNSVLKNSDNTMLKEIINHN